MHLATIPARALYLDPSWFVGGSRSDVGGFYMYSGNELVSRKLIVGGIAGSAHEGGFSVFREFNGGDGGEGRTL